MRKHGVEELIPGEEEEADAGGLERPRFDFTWPCGVLAWGLGLEAQSTAVRTWL